MRPVPATAGRHVYLWHADPDLLRRQLPADLVANLDLNEIAAALPRAPSALDAARQLLLGAIRAWLRDHRPLNGVRQIVVVTGAALLMRYQLPLHEFFQAADDTRLVIWVVPAAETDFDPRPLPPYVQVRPRATVEYLQAALGSAPTIGV